MTDTLVALVIFDRWNLIGQGHIGQLLNDMTLDTNLSWLHC